MEPKSKVTARRKAVVVESPFSGKTQLDVDINVLYARFCMYDCLTNYGESPYASHLLYTQPFVLDDAIPEERKLGIEAGLEWSVHADVTVLYTDLGISDGMRYGIDYAATLERKCEVRKLPSDLKARFDQEADKLRHLERLRRYQNGEPALVA